MSIEKRRRAAALQRLSLLYRLSLIASMILLSALICATPCSADGRKVVLIVADYISLSDLTENAPPHLAKLVSESGIGLMSLGAVGSRTVESGYATTGAGASSWAQSMIDEAYSSSEPMADEFDSAGVVFKRRTGDSSPSAVVHLEMALLGEEGAKRYSAARPGALADAISAAGKKTAVFGNADTEALKRRRTVAIAATGMGSVPVGDVSSKVTRLAPTSPQGFVSDVARMAQDVDSALKTADFVVVDIGDTARVELAKRDLSPTAYKLHRRNALDALDGFIARIMAGRASDATIILLAMAPPMQDPGDPKQLSPVLVHTPGGRAGCLISSTTRTEGLVAGFDIAPTVLAQMGLPKSAGMIGWPVYVADYPQTEVKRLDGLVELNSLLLWPILGIVGGLGIAAATLGALAVAFPRRFGRRWTGVARAFMVFSVSSPLAMLIATPGNPSVGPYLLRLFGTMAALTAESFALAAFLKRVLGDRLERLPGALPYIVIAAATTATIVIDAFTGGHLVRFTIINAAQFEGYRFYGVGNEYMGVCLGMGMASILWMRECFPGWHRRWSGRAIMLLATLSMMIAIGYPRFGANAGGLLAAVVGLGLLCWTGTGRRFGAREVIVSLIAGFLVVGAVGVLDMLISRGTQSHIGLAASMSGRQGCGFLTAMAVRKLTMNFRLIVTSQSEWAIVGSIPFFALWFLGVGPRVNRMLGERPALRWGIFAALAGTLTAFLFNDSGIVAGGLDVELPGDACDILSAEC